MTNVVATTIQGTRAILQGMGMVLRHLFRPAFTVSYPEVRRPMPPRTRNRLAFLYDEETDKMRCIGCTSCVVVCPREIIHLKVDTVEKKKVVVQFDVDLGDCIGCGNCVEICPVDALELLPDFELAAERKEDLLYDMHKLGKTVAKDYLPAQFYPAKSEPPKPVRATPPVPPGSATPPTALTADAATTLMEKETGTPSPDAVKEAARARTEALKAARAAAKAPDNGTMPSVGKSPEEIQEAGRRKAAELKAAREAAKAVDVTGTPAMEPPSQKDEPSPSGETTDSTGG